MMYFDPNGLYTFGEWLSIGGAGVGGLGQGAANVGGAAYNLVAGPASLAGTLSTSSGRQQTANSLALAAAMAKKFANDPCFRAKMEKLLGDDAKSILSDPDKLSKLLANLGVGGLTLGAGALAGGGAEADAALAELEAMSPEAMTTGFRAVSDAELQQIVEDGRFFSPADGSTPTGNAGKFFYTDQSAAQQAASVFSKEGISPANYTVIKAEVPTSSIGYTEHLGDGHIVPGGADLFFSEYPGLHNAVITHP
jgi:hypothetical protein